MSEPRNILIVDDSSDDVLLVQHALRKLPRPPIVHAVYDGSDAIAYLEGQGLYADRNQYPIPDLIILDLKMKRVHGFEFLEWLRAHPEHRPLVVVLSGSIIETDKAKSLQLGAREYHAKHADHNETIVMLAGICERWLK